MASEYRLIFFDQNELCRALIEYNRQRKTPFPPGNLKKIVIDRDSLNVTINIDMDSGQTTTVSFDPSSVAAAMIVYCKERKIPLPSKSAKEMRMVADRLCFLIRIKGSPAEAAIAVEYTGKLVASEAAE
ncbi:MAG: hypothetical protein ACKOEE_09165 [Tagaea sp.]|jgi:hypothetical protein|nr:hypothetical protein [Azospirillum sp.]MCA3266905.1 hypothetical protein [Azospirillum sp.]MCZ8125059.1 hypothetical protein [Magnetospirillum sp.]